MTKHQRASTEQLVSLSLSLSLGAVTDRSNKRTRRAAVIVAGGEFMCKTCNRSFPMFQALGGHRTSHLRGCNGLALALTGTTPVPEHKKATDQKQQAHQCHVCGQGFEIEALGPHLALAVARPPPPRWRGACSSCSSRFMIG
ncbi:hypothetical protein ZWY2020_030823 [Hordeum vulgare]|nr:hypothetical protein ZWY2020_030823 [Hordeum vulgare]